MGIRRNFTKFLASCGRTLIAGLGGGYMSDNLGEPVGTISQPIPIRSNPDKLHQPSNFTKQLHDNGQAYWLAPDQANSLGKKLTPLPRKIKGEAPPYVYNEGGKNILEIDLHEKGIVFLDADWVRERINPPKTLDYLQNAKKIELEILRASGRHGIVVDVIPISEQDKQQFQDFDSGDVHKNVSRWSSISSRSTKSHSKAIGISNAMITGLSPNSIRRSSR